MLLQADSSFFCTHTGGQRIFSYAYRWTTLFFVYRIAYFQVHFDNKLEEIYDLLYSGRALKRSRGIRTGIQKLGRFI